jgi:hypothetical protein
MPGYIENFKQIQNRTEKEKTEKDKLFHPVSYATEKIKERKNKMAETYDISKATKAQEKYCAEKGYPHFAPHSGKCFSCGQNIYSEKGRTRSGKERNGISVERASKELITGCPFCNRTYCD